MNNLNGPSVAPLDYNIVPFGITINVSPKKILSNRKLYGDLSENEQQEAIRAVFSYALHAISKSAEDCEIVFEKTKAGHVHLHGLIACTQREIILFQSLVHKQLGFPKLDPSICCKFVRTIISTGFWVRYMNKYVKKVDLDDDGHKVCDVNMFVD